MTNCRHSLKLSWIPAPQQRILREKQEKRRLFTLIELLIVIAMTAILLHSKSGFFMANYGNGVILILNMLPIDTMNENVDTW